MNLQIQNLANQLIALNRTGGVDRAEFRFNQYADPIWSDYDLNSITFTLDLMQEPFFSPSYPSAFNFGLLGSLIGRFLGF
jgi:predicted metalloendopeptidase